MLADPSPANISTPANSARTSKPPRVETQSQASMATSAHGGAAAGAAPTAMSASLPPPKQAAKKQKKTTSLAAQPAIPDPEPNLVPDVVDGDAEATDGGIDAARTRVRHAGRSRLLTAQEKHDRFQAKYNGKTPEQILDTILKGWRSRVYEHFKAPFIVRSPKGAVMHCFVCKRSPSKHVDRADYEDSTGNLKRHAKLCEPEDTPEQQAISAFAAGSTYSPTRLRFLLAIWCATRHRPFAIVEDPEFKGILGMLYGKVHIPSRVTISRDIHNIVDECTTHVIELFERIPGKIHLCVDGWSSPNVMSFLGVTAHWHHEGQIQHIILDFIKLTRAHTGTYLAEKLMECLRKFGIEYKVLAVTADNATNNDSMINKLSRLFPLFRGSDMRVRCFAHVIALVVKAILTQFSRKRAAKGEKKADVKKAAQKISDDLSDHNLDADEEAKVQQEKDVDREATDEKILDTLEEEYPDLVLSCD